MAVVPNVGRRFFPLDEELGLLPGQYTPGLQETMTRLGSKMPFQEAVKEIQASYRTNISEPTVRRTTHKNGWASEALEREAAEKIEVDGPRSAARPERLVISTDGAFIALTSGEWREVKTVCVGEFASDWNSQGSKMEVKSSQLSYFSRSYRAREFERYALAELHRRGLDEAQKVVAVNDGAAWIQSFNDYHCPQAVRVIDFAHAQGYVAQIGKAILGEETTELKAWLKDKAHQAKHEPPQRLLSELAWFGHQAQTDEQKTVIEQGLRYLSQRQEMIDYRHFRAQGYPIGSGSVESSHKHVVHKRLKQAGMRWSEHHVDPLLALRNLISNDRWADGWQELVNYRRKQRWVSRINREQATVSPPITLASVKVAPETPASPSLPTDDTMPKKPWKPATDHPWRRPWRSSRS
jgi:hypothetical protein